MLSFKMNKLFQEYKRLLKGTGVEEVFDLFLFRPFAFILVKLIYRLPVTPNQLSLLSIITAILSAIFFSLGNSKNFVIAGLLYGLTRIIDCSDGMIARLKKNGTLTGRIVDGTVDYVNTILIYTGLGIGLSKASFKFPVSSWILVIFAAICMGLHSGIIDYYRSEFMSHALSNKNSPLEDKELFSTELKKIKHKKGKFFDKLLIRFYLVYLDIQVTKQSKKRKYNQKTYYEANKLLLYFWTLVGSSTYIFVLMVASILYKPGIFFFYVLIAANIWATLLWIIQIKTNKKIVIKEI